MPDFVASVLSNLVSAAIIAIFAAFLWPSRFQLLAAFRFWVRVKDVNLYLSEHQDAWNLEIPHRYVNDVKWRLRAFNLRPTSFISSMTADESTDAFRFRIAGYDQSLEDDIPEILDTLRLARVRLSPSSHWGTAKRRDVQAT